MDPACPPTRSVETAPRFPGTTTGYERQMRALVLNATLKASPERSNTDALLEVVADAMRGDDVEVEVVRLVDHDIKPGITNDEGDGDGWPDVLAQLRNAQIVVIATPTWLGQPSSVAKRAL